MFYRHFCLPPQFIRISVPDRQNRGGANLGLTWDIMNATITVVRGTSTGKKKLKG
jgi:hypothetical protein